MSEEEKKLYMKYCKYDEEPKKNILNLIEIIEKQQKEYKELKEIEAEYKKTNSELFKNNVELRIENERLKYERIKHISSNLNNSIKQKQKEDEQLNALNEGWKIELENKNKEIKELKEKYDKDTHTLQNQLDIANADKINNYICKSEIKCKIEELDIEISECEYSDDDDEKYKKAVEKDKLYLLNQKRVLQELIEESEE